MAGLIDDLIAIMEKEAVCYESYLEIANNKKEVIIKGDVPSLQEITQEEEIVAGQLFRLEKSRKEIIEDICTVTNRKIENFKILDLVEELSAREEESQRLKEVAQRLETALKECEQVNQTNKMLIRQSLEFLEFSINALTGLTQGNSSQTYVKRGEALDSHSERPIFDAKQ
ncbi:MAG: flagellar protein FlgN [Eubacteriales bacterium]|nr:flagellar protein FlgN [Eubacteriales bacterium]